MSWNRHVPYITREDAFGLYEANWRFLKEEDFDAAEMAFLEELRAEFGSGVLNV